MLRRPRRALVFLAAVVWLCRWTCLEAAEVQALPPGEQQLPALDLSSVPAAAAAAAAATPLVAGSRGSAGTGWGVHTSKQQQQRLDRHDDLRLQHAASLPAQQQLRRDTGAEQQLETRQQLERQQQQQQQQQQKQQHQKQKQKQRLQAELLPPAPPPWVQQQQQQQQLEEAWPSVLMQEPWQEGTAEYLVPLQEPHRSSVPTHSAAGTTPAAAAAAGAGASTALRSPGRRLTQLPPSYCGKLGTYVPNYYSNVDGSMFGLSISPNTDGSVIGVGSPINGPDAKQAGGASVLTSWSDKTCEYAVVPLWQPDGCYKYYGAQVALSTDGTTFVVMDGVEGIKTDTAEGNRPVVHVYRRYTNGTFVYMQRLDVAPRRAMAAAMAVSITGDAQTILVSFSVGEGFPDKRGSTQVFVLDGTGAAAQYIYLQDLADLNMPAGASVQFGQSSVISDSGVFVAVGTASNTNAYFNLAYMYKKDEVTGRFRIVSTISSGEHLPDPSPVCSAVGLSDSNPVAISQSGRFVLKVESSMLVVYEWSGAGMTVTWQRRCQLAAPDGYTFRTTAGALSIVEVGHKRVKFAAGAYVGTLDTPEQMAVFLFYLDAGKPGTCPYRPAEKHVHNSAFSNYGAGVSLTLDGKLLIVGAPTAWDNNMDCQSGAVYLIDVDKVADDGLEAKTITQAANVIAGCVNGVDPNGNPCVTKQKHDPICKDVKLKDGRVIHYGPPGCSPTPPLTRNFWAATLPGEAAAAVPARGVSAAAAAAGAPAAAAAAAATPFRTSRLSAYTTVQPSVKGGVGVPTGSDVWLQKQAKAALQSSYFGLPTAAIAKPKESIISAAGWPSSVTPALGGLQSHLNTVGATTAAPPGISALSLLSSGLGALLGKAGGGGGGGVGGGGGLPALANLGASGAGLGRAIGIGPQVGGPALPLGAVIKNPEVLRQQPLVLPPPAPAAAAAAVPAAAAG